MHKEEIIISIKSYDVLKANGAIDALTEFWGYKPNFILMNDDGIVVAQSENFNNEHDYLKIKEEVDSWANHRQEVFEESKENCLDKVNKNKVKKMIEKEKRRAHLCLIK